MKISRIFEFLQDEKGIFSSTRLVFIIWSIGMLVCWIIMSIEAKQFVPIPSEAMWILLSLMTGKAIQKFGECGEKPKSSDSAAAASGGDGGKPPEKAKIA